MQRKVTAHNWNILAHSEIKIFIKFQIAFNVSIHLFVHCKLKNGKQIRFQNAEKMCQVYMFYTLRSI